jgi:uncharacterized protein (UPF0264 family)
MLKFDGFDKALMGVAEVWAPTGAGMALVTVAIYDGERMVKTLIKHMAEQEAREFISFAIEGKPMGPQTPIIYWPEH